MKANSSHIRTTDIGRKGENQALDWYTSQGYTILHTNYTYYTKGHIGRIGEIDIIALKDSLLLFIEVKTRRNRTFGHALEHITPAKIQALTRTAQNFISEYPHLVYTDTRFDLCIIQGTRITTIENIL